MGTFNGIIEVRTNKGELKQKTTKIYEQNGSVIRGTVLFPNGRPVEGAVVVLSSVNSNGTISPVTFTFTNKCGQYTFGIKDTNYDYIVEITYNEHI